jgi:hypothetical protein
MTSATVVELSPITLYAALLMKVTE